MWRIVFSKKEYEFIFLLAYRLGILLMLYLALRFLFLYFNLDQIDISSKTEIVKAFVIGFKFDLSAIAFYNAIVIVLHLIPFEIRRNTTYQKVIKIFFYVFNILALAIAISDIEYYKFNFKRIDIGVIGLFGTFSSMGGSFFNEFWHLLVIFVLLLLGIEYLYRRVEVKKKVGNLNLPIQGMIFIVGIGLSIISIRGGWRVQIPIRSLSAAEGLKPELIPLATNSPFTFYRSLMSFKVKERIYLDEGDLLQQYSLDRGDLNNIPVQKNVVIFLLESFTKYYISSLNGGREKYTPFLDSLMEKGIACTNGFANGRRSNQGLVSVVSGIPPLMEVPYMYSAYADNKQISLPLLLRNEGYSTAFFNGSNKEMLNWESYIYYSGFTHYYGREEYNNDKHYDGGWGIYDHYFLNYMADQLDTLSKPFFTTVLTLTSHHPYTVPPELEGFDDEKIGPYLNSLKYADFALKEFFQKAKKKEWFKNTIFVFVADHTAAADGISPDEERDGRIALRKNRVGLYSIPILFYQPDSTFTGKINFPVQQIDIFPSLMDLLGYNKKYKSFGESIFRGDSMEKYSFNYVNGVYQILDNNNLLLFNGEVPIAFYNYKKDSFLTDNILDDSLEESEGLSKKIKAVIQTYHHTLINNKYFWNGLEKGPIEARDTK